MEKKSSSAPSDTAATAAPEAPVQKPAAAENNSSPAAGAPAQSQPTAPQPPDNAIRVEGVLDIDLQRGGNGQLVNIEKGGKRRPTDPFVPKELIRRF